MDLLIPNFSEFHFLRPLWLLGLIPAIVLLLALWRVNNVVTAWDRAIDSSLLPFLLDRNKNASQRTPLLMLAIAWILAIVALSGPVWEKLPQPVQQRQDALVIVLDLSLSMFASDHEPNRLDLAKRKLRDLLVRREEGLTALVVYAGDAHTVTPLTDDTVTISALVPSLSPNIMPLFGSNPMAGVQQAVRMLDEVAAVRGKILLMTDGINGFSEEQLLAEQLQATDYELLVMGIGTERGATIRTSDGTFLTNADGQVVIAQLNRSVLQSLANRVSGRYHDIQLSNADLDHLLSDFNPLDDSLSDVEEEFDVWYEAGPWLLLLILPLAALSFRRGWLFSIVLITAAGVLIPSEQVHAQGWTDLWKTRDQRAAEAFSNEQHEEAANLFQSSQWRAAANYRAENYDTAIAEFSAINTAEAHYNRGNALAHAGNYPEAIAAYDQAIALTELTGDSHEDAAFNKAIVEQLLEEEESDVGEAESDESDQSEQQPGDSEQEPENTEQQDQESQEGNQEEQEEQEQQQQNQEPPEQQEDSQSNSEQNTPNEETNEEFEEQQSLEQWLRRIEDDPGELLQRKFRFQYRQRQLDGTANNYRSGDQIW
ncbi:MAG: VWA domain-containing protein [Pseudohongiellaceae bacterium]